MMGYWADSMRTLFPAFVTLLVLAGAALGEGERPEPLWRKVVPPGVSATDGDNGRFRIDEMRDPLRGFEDDASGDLNAGLGYQWNQLMFDYGYHIPLDLTETNGSHRFSLAWKL